MKRFWQHPWTVTVCNWLLVMAIFSLSRLFYYLTNLSEYPDISFRHLMEIMGGGIRFDMTASLYLNCVYILLQLFPLRIRQHTTYRNIAKWFYWIPNALGIIVNCVDMVYMEFTGKRTTIAFFDEFENEGNLTRIFFIAAVQYWYVTLFGLAMLALLFWLTRRQVQTDDARKPWAYYSSETAILLISAYFVVIGIRGGFGAFTRPITLSNAMQYTSQPNEVNIVLNTPFALMRSTEGQVFPDFHYFEPDELEQVMTPVHCPQEGAQLKQKNVVVFILESFTKEYLGYCNHDLDSGRYQGYTPFLDSLVEHALTFPLTLACSGRSIDGMPSVLSSIPMMYSPYILTPYSTNNVSSIAGYLGPKGWQTAFFHGAPNGSMGFQAYARSCGFEAYYGMDEYPDKSDFDGTWAIWDEEFLQFYAQTMSTMTEPVMTSGFTATSHHPFVVPERYKGVFPKGTMPIHQCIGYTDNALRQFFNYAKTQPWYENTLFVLTADHVNMRNTPEYNNSKGLYEVPIIFFDPQMDEEFRTRERNYPVSQADILPSVLGYLGYDEPYFAFGEDAITREKEHPYVVSFYADAPQIFSDSLLMRYNGEQMTALYNIKKDRGAHKNILEEHQEDEAVQDMLRYLQAMMQQYTSRMKQNRLIITEEDGSSCR